MALVAFNPGRAEHNSFDAERPIKLALFARRLNNWLRWRELM